MQNHSQKYYIATNKLQTPIFEILNSLPKNKNLIFTDAYKENIIIDTIGGFLDIIFKNCQGVYQNFKEQNIPENCHGVIFCCLLNNKNEINVSSEESTIETFFHLKEKNTPCTIIYIDIPFQLKQLITFDVLPNIICKYTER